MRKITSNAINAFMNNSNFKSGNTEVFYSKSQNATYLSLHGNTIAIKHKDSLQISTCGWQSNATKERLNALPGVSIQQKNSIWHLNGKEWDGKLIKIS